MNDNQNRNDNTDDNQSEKKHTSAAGLDSIISGATDNVRSRRSGGTLGNTGTNISYEGATAPGGGGSVGTGYSSGQEATGADITETSGTGEVHENREDTSGENLEKPEQMGDDLDRDTMGTP